PGDDAARRPFGAAYRRLRRRADQGAAGDAERRAHRAPGGAGVTRGIHGAAPGELRAGRRAPGAAPDHARRRIRAGGGAAQHVEGDERSGRMSVEPKSTTPGRAPLHPYLVMLIAIVAPGSGQWAAGNVQRGVIFVWFILIFGWIGWHLAGPGIS